MSEPGTPLPWFVFDEFMILADKSDLKVCDTEFGESLDARKDAAYIVEACNNFPEAIKLLRDCYIAGHRQGWEDGPTNQEVFDRVAMFMHHHDSEWWKQQQWESEAKDE